MRLTLPMISKKIVKYNKILSSYVEVNARLAESLSIYSRQPRRKSLTGDNSSDSGADNLAESSKYIIRLCDMLKFEVWEDLNLTNMII